MTSSRSNVPPVALKDRIAALQQLKANQSSNDQRSTPINMGTGPSIGSLQDKIANFEKKGAVPVPRGSFGLGAPPVDDGSSRRKGELYGNRVPGLSKPTVDSVLPNARKRTVSTSHLPTYSVSRSTTPTLPDFSDNSNGERPSSPSTSVRNEERFSNALPLHLPSLAAPTMRRAVSDVLPLTHTSDDITGGDSNARLDGPLFEEEAVSGDSEKMAEDDVKGRADGTHEVDVSREEESEAGDHEDSMGRPTIVVSTVITPQPSPAVPNTASTAPSSPPSAYSSASLYNTEAYPPTPVSASPFPGSREDARSPTTPSSEIRYGEEGYSAEALPVSPIAPTPPSGVSPSDLPSPGTKSPAPVPDSDEIPVADTMRSTPPELDPTSTADDGSGSSDAVPTPKDDVFSNVILPETNKATVDIPAETIRVKPLVNVVLPDVTPTLSHEITVHDSVIPKLELPASSDTRRLSLGFNLFTSEESLFAEKSLALDTSDAVIVSEPPRVVSPTLSRATIVPAPRPSSSPLSSPVSPAAPSSPWVSDLEQQMSAASSRQSFHAVVHHKVRGQASQPPAATELNPEPRAAQPSRPPRLPTAARTSIVISEDPPDSPGLGDLAFLMQNAVILEEQLSGPSPSKTKVPTKPKPVQAELTITPPPPVMTPAASISASTDVSEPATPKQLVTPHPRPASVAVDHIEEEEEQDTFDMDDIPLGRTMLMFPTPRSSSLAYLNPTPPHSPATRSADPRLEVHQAYPPHGSPASSRTRLESNASERSRVESDASQRTRLQSNASEEIPPTPPPKSPRYFPNLRMRKPSMPGAFPRTSYSSEDSSMIATPPSPSQYYQVHDSQSERSDTSSIRSSSKSLKNPKRSRTLGRAGSVVERLWRGGKGKGSNSSTGNDDDAHLSAGAPSQRAPSPTHLSPYNLPPVPRLPSGMQRPTSWVSIETTGSNGEVFDTDLFDSFPSVPDPTSAHRQYRSASSHLSPSDYGQDSEMGYVGSANMPATLPTPRSNVHAKQRSSMI